MSLLLATLKLDVRLQARSKLYAIGIVVAILLGLAGRFFVHPDYAGKLLAVFYLAGLGSTTYMFSASLVLLEKSQGTLLALRTTPLTSTAYIASKVITLTSFAALESAIVYAIAFFGVWKYFADRNAEALAQAQSRSLAYIARFAGDDMVNARAELVKFWQQYPEFGAFARQGAITEREYSNFVAATYPTYSLN